MRTQETRFSAHVTRRGADDDDGGLAERRQVTARRRAEWGEDAVVPPGDTHLGALLVSRDDSEGCGGEGVRDRHLDGGVDDLEVDDGDVEGRNRGGDPHAGEG